MQLAKMLINDSLCINNMVFHLESQEKLTILLKQKQDEDT